MKNLLTIIITSLVGGLIFTLITGKFGTLIIVFFLCMVLGFIVWGIDWLIRQFFN